MLGFSRRFSTGIPIQKFSALIFGIRIDVRKELRRLKVTRDFVE